MGIPPTVTVGTVGIQVPAMAGTQGIGVKTPMAAAVAAATVGLAGDWHIPKVGILAPGAQSLILAMGIILPVTLGRITMREHGATPMVQVIIAPIVTAVAIEDSPSLGLPTPPRAIFSSSESDKLVKACRSETHGNLAIAHQRPLVLKSVTVFGLAFRGLKFLFSSRVDGPDVWSVFCSKSLAGWAVVEA